MGRKDTQTINFDCDWKCGASFETNDRNDLERGLPPDWEQVNKMSTAVMTTAEYKGIPYLLCPDCWALFKTLSSVDHRHKRLLEFVRAWRDSENEIRRVTTEHMETNKPISVDPFSE